MNQSPADYIIYKGKAALQFSLKPGKPVPIKTERGEYTGTDKGCIFVVAANSRGPRDYDWKNKVTIGLSEHEVSKFMLGLKGKKQTFYHDTNKGKSNEGEVIKSMTISPSGDKLFVNLSMIKNGKETKIHGVPVEPEEAAGLHALLSSALPRILGWS
jgi:hypothetical protein